MVVQYLATPWIQSYLCKNKIAQDAMRMLAAIFTLRSKLGVIYIDNSFEFTKACEGDRGAAGGCAMPQTLEFRGSCADHTTGRACRRIFLR